MIRLLGSTFALTLALSIDASTAHASAAEQGQACAAETYRARGVVKGFTEERKLVNIAHENIEGFMMAMTMTFEPRSAAQVAKLKVGDRVHFTFTVTDDGRRLLDQVTVD